MQYSKKILLVLGIFGLGLISRSFFYSSPVQQRTTPKIQNSPKAAKFSPQTAPLQKPIPTPAKIQEDQLFIRSEVRSSSSDVIRVFLQNIETKSKDRMGQAKGKEGISELPIAKSKLLEQLRNSPAARDEYVKVIQSERDIAIKDKLLQIVGKMEPIQREEIALPLSYSDNRDDRKVASSTLANIGTKIAVDTLQHSIASDPDPDVREAALNALAKFHPRGTGPEWADSASVILFWNELAEKETSPRVREIALAAQQTLSSQ